MSSPQYQIEAYPCVSSKGYRTVCYTATPDNDGDVVAMDTPIPIIQPCVIEINSKGEVRRVIWRV